MNAPLQEKPRITLRTLRLEDYGEIRKVMKLAYRGLRRPWWEKHQFKILLGKFPEGQLCIEVNGKVVACALSLIVRYGKLGHQHTYDQVTGRGTFSAHDVKGDVLYGIDIFVHPEYQSMRLGRRLYDARKQLCENLALRSIITGGRIPNYSKHSDQMRPDEYIEKVKLREIYDPTLTFQLANDFHVIKVLRNYLSGDRGSKEYATLLEWNNIYYLEREKLISSEKTVARIGLVQWQMRPFKDLESLMQQVEFFVDAISGYQADFLLLPEFFNAPLMARFNDLPESAAIRKLAEYTRPIGKLIAEYAVNYNINIIAGSMPYLSRGRLLNLTHLFRRDGTREEFFKIHVTPAEFKAWGMVGGDKLNVFDTDCGKIGILTCYDIEFPELSRIYAEQGVQIIFVPFQTDTQNGYTRVRCCAQARAIENECYVAITGCVGNLPGVSNMDIQYAQSAVFTPCDFSFPTDGVRAQTTPNTEMTLIADVDLDLLKELHTHGTVRNLLDRRTDLYDLRWRQKGLRVNPVQAGGKIPLVKSQGQQA